MRIGARSLLRSAAITVEDERVLRMKLETLVCESELKFDLNLEIIQSESSKWGVSCAPLLLWPCRKQTQVEERRE
jgi:hypothetical protein